MVPSRRVTVRALAVARATSGKEAEQGSASLSCNDQSARATYRA
ncbi:hypothetical protein RSPO_c00240 [Ralstonia solanacearum Po82]|uniref:Uncharacterized protein n=1 Tax=Ralstonia solanacearum (strain Po82) TaxID=1031711 RepID=F6G6J9_RALS8|nr:hypothetical protein RSPO_c00240 [Ralstonia solanacearum Po82]